MGFFLQYIPIFVIIFVICLTAWFILSYAKKAWAIQKLLSKSAQQVHTVSNSTQDIIKKQLSTIFSDQTLEHAWKLYEATLHEQTEVIDGEVHVIQVRATVPSEAFFNQQNIVDTPIESDFFKHLPGIMTPPSGRRIAPFFMPGVWRSGILEGHDVYTDPAGTCGVRCRPPSRSRLHQPGQGKQRQRPNHRPLQQKPAY